MLDPYYKDGQRMCFVDVAFRKRLSFLFFIFCSGVGAYNKHSFLSVCLAVCLSSSSSKLNVHK